tara:strand:- start:1444 stop:2043 length:600 start_codon:yes stop_codon:yes gene_type:complete
MNYNFEYLDIVLLALFAGFIILRLREILGRKTGHESKVYKNLKQTDFKENIDLNRPLSRLDDFDDKAKKNFLKGADAAYEKIITAFSKGDKNNLKSLLGKKIYENFSDAIDERNKNKIKSETTFIGVKSSKISEFVKEDNIFKITVKFVSEMIICLKDKDNKIIEGNPDVIKMVYDNWKFSKNMWSQNPNWYLIETTDK